MKTPKIERVIAGYDPQSPEYQDVFFGGFPLSRALGFAAWRSQE